MKDEIREILDTKLYFDLEEEDYIKIKDYITNLQQENERLKEILKWKQNKESELFTIESVLETNKQLYDERNIYKSRVEKAVEYLKECYTQPENIENFMTESEMNYLLNILQNGSENK